MSMDDKKLSMLPADDVTSRRELLSATAKLSAFISAVGLTGIGLSGAAAQDPPPEEEPPNPRASKRLRKLPRRGVIAPEERPSPMHKVRPKTGLRHLPAVQKRQMKLLLNDALRTGDSRLALKRHPNLKLNRRQKAALMRVSKQDWAHLRRLKAQLAPLGDLAAGDTGYVFW